MTERRWSAGGHLLVYDGGSVAVDGQDTPDEEEKLDEGTARGESDLLQEHLGQEDEGEDAPVAEGVEGVRPCRQVVGIIYLSWSYNPNRPADKSEFNTRYQTFTDFKMHWKCFTSIKKSEAVK